jgi:hypothetical protein
MPRKAAEAQVRGLLVNRDTVNAPNESIASSFLDDVVAAEFSAGCPDLLPAHFLSGVIVAKL